MQVIWSDGFDTTIDPNNAPLYWSKSTSGFRQWRSLAGIGEGTCLQFTNKYTWLLTQSIGDTSYPEWHICMSIKQGGGNYTADYPFLELKNESNVPVCTLRINAAGGIDLYRGGTNLITFVNSTLTSEWKDLYLRISLSNTATVEARIDGMVVCDDTFDTSDTPGEYLDRIALIGPWDSTSTGDGTDGILFDHLVIVDGSGSGLSEPIVRSRIYTRRPTYDYSVSWTPSIGTDNFELVNDILGTSTRYISSNSTNVDDIYNYQSLSLSEGTIRSVCVFNTGYRDGAFDASYFHAIAERVSSTVISNGQKPTVSGLYYLYANHFYTDPYTGDSWEDVNFSASRFGVRRTT